MSKLIHLNIQDRVAIIELNRPERFNSLNNDLRDAIESAFDACAKNDSVGAVVLSAAGPHFSVGYDLEEVISTKLQSFGHRVFEYHCAVYLFPKPVVTAVRGFSLAGGFDLALGGDYLITSEKSMFGHPEIKFGAPPLVTSLARKIGGARALQSIWRGDSIPAKKALEMGFVNEVVPDEKLLPRAIDRAKKFAAMDPLSMKLTKRMANTLFDGDLKNSLKTEFDAFVEVFQQSDDLLKRITSYYDGLKSKQGPG